MLRQPFRTTFLDLSCTAKKIDYSNVLILTDLEDDTVLIPVSRMWRIAHNVKSRVDCSVKFRGLKIISSCRPGCTEFRVIPNVYTTPVLGNYFAKQIWIHSFLKADIGENKDLSNLDRSLSKLNEPPRPRFEPGISGLRVRRDVRLNQYTITPQNNRIITRIAQKCIARNNLRFYVYISDSTPSKLYSYF